MENSNVHSSTLSPKHIPFPEISNNSEIVNEILLFLFGIFSAAMQFLHIYRTAWWFSDSHINHAINLYLIDTYLVVFIAVILSRRLLYLILNKIIEMTSINKNVKFHKTIAKYSFCTSFSIIIGNCIINIYSKHNYICFFLLLYPLVVYFLIFGPHIQPFLRMTPEATYINNVPMHCCSTNSITIREEIEILKNDFNNRFKQSIFTSLFNSYYVGFVPCFFAQNYIYYDVLYATQHVAFVFLNTFLMCLVFCFPAKYCDILHRASLHLGLWQRIDGRSNITQAPATWSKIQSWNSGSIVRYSGDLYKSIGPITTSIPGNTTHYRFQKLFHNPSILYMTLTISQISIIILQIIVLYFATEWLHILSLSFLTLTNNHTLFQIVRDYFITQKVYAAESSIYEKLSLHFT